MGVDKLYKNSVKDTINPITGEINLEGEDFIYEIYLLPIIGSEIDKIKEKEQELVTRIGNRKQNGKICLDIDETLVRENILYNDYSAFVFVKNKNYDDNASGTMQLYDWCNSGNNQIWINDLCRISTEKRNFSPIKALLQVFEMITIKYTKNIKFIHVMVDKEKPDEAEILKNIYSKYGFTVVENNECNIDDDNYIIMKKLIDKNNIPNLTKKIAKTVTNKTSKGGHKLKRNTKKYKKHISYTFSHLKRLF
jgi:hypothetical protein